ncbi:MAG: hypothetical protein AAF694_19045 [Bacteroidota bacterium]
MAADKIRQLIAENLLEEAAQELTHTPIREKGIALLRRVKDLNEKIYSGQITHEGANIEKNQISIALLEAVRQLESPGILGKSPKFKSTVFGKIAGAIFLLGIIAVLIYLYGPLGKEKESSVNTLTVFVHGAEGMDDLVLPSRGEVSLIYGDAKVTKQINKEGEVTFRQIPEVFFEAGTGVKILFSDPEGEPYQSLYPDSSYSITADQYVSLVVNLKGTGFIQGYVKDFQTGKYLDSAKVMVKGEYAFSNAEGYFSLEIPTDKQYKYQTIRIQKSGYEEKTLSNVPVDENIEIEILIVPD